jgi:NAD(P)-dependent dehydrogenase (short-subunit alcohol dehydrogenase family)
MPANVTGATTGQSVWFITGCSTGFGRELASQLLARGNRVVVTARDPSALAQFAGMENALVQRLDVTDAAQIAAAVQAAETRFGHIDVLVNNAGIGYFAAVEEGEDDEIRRMFDINLFGLAAVTCAALPGMRKRRQGFIVNFSSIGGLRSFPAIGWYNATKFAVEGLSEALWQETEPLGIRVMLVEPSGFRTDWAGRSANESKVQIADYAATAGAARAGVRAVSGKQAGDPVRAAEAIIKAVEAPNPPHHLLLGNDAFEGATAKLAELGKNFASWEAVSRGADFPDDDVPNARTHRAA